MAEKCSKDIDDKRVNHTCFDPDCPWPEHEGECPTPTLELWRTEAQRCRKLVSRYAERLFEARETFEKLFGAPPDEARLHTIDALKSTVLYALRNVTHHDAAKALDKLAELAKDGRMR